MTTSTGGSGGLATSDEEDNSSCLSSCPSDMDNDDRGVVKTPRARVVGQPQQTSSPMRSVMSESPSATGVSSALSTPATSTVSSSPSSSNNSSKQGDANGAAPPATSSTRGTPSSAPPAKRKYTKRRPVVKQGGGDGANGMLDASGRPSSPVTTNMDTNGVVVTRMKATSAQDVPRPDANVDLEKILFFEPASPTSPTSAAPVTNGVSEDAPMPDVPNGEEAQHSGPAPGSERFYIKFKNRSYLHCEWVDREWIESHDKRGKQRLKHFMEKTIHEFPYSLLTADRPFNDAYTKIDRLLAENEAPDPFTRELTHWYLVKWCALPYDQVTWESQATLLHYCDEAEEKIEEYNQWNELPHIRNPDYFKTYLPVGKRPHPQAWQKMEASPVYKDGNTLRPYQLEGVNWLMYCWHHRQSSIIADEMGLGKTVQSIAFLKQLYDTGVRGPFLIVAPLSTIPHWERTVLGWTDMNPVVFHGSSAARNIIQNYELYYRCPRTQRKLQISHPVTNGHFEYKFDVMITTYEMALSSASFLKSIGVWRVMVVDEAHRLKSKSSKATEVLSTYAMEHRVLLTGTPLQNNLDELWAILNFLDPVTFRTDSEKQFLADYDIRSAADVQKLQAVLKPLMLRRLKEDVEKSIPVKEETIVEVELTSTQRAYYRAILERNFQFLKQGTGKKANMPNLINAMMELRKCCIHPYLITGAEEKIVQDQKPQTADEFLDCMITASGKLVFLDKLLPKLKQGGHRVLIFSQMTRCLDILSDYLRGKGYLHERIDGAVRGDARQAAIDRFSQPDSECFVFLLCTRAGGVGINLTAADTCIIYDSDWNPQNDLQAQARCHRIGQKKSVQIYRLITRNTYEKTMFDKAGMKLGLDRAVLSRMDFDAEKASSSQLSKAEIEELLKKGAYAALDVEDGGEDEAKKFCEEDIDAILTRRTQTIRHTDTAEQEKIQAEGSLFSKAHFALPSNGAENVPIDDPEFWDKWAKRANLDPNALVEESVVEKLIVSGPRKRKVRQSGRGEDGTGNAGDDEELGPDDEESPPFGGGRPRLRYGGYAATGNAWTIADRQRVERGLMAYGFGAWERKAETMSYRRSVDEIKAAEIRLLRWCMEAMRREKASADSEGIVRSAKQAAALREEQRMFEDVETIISRVRWGVPSAAELEQMVAQGCSASFEMPAEQAPRHVDPELGEFPYPGATREAALLHRNFLDGDCPASYIASLAKKPRNMLLRVQNMDFIRQYVCDLDPHAVADVPLPPDAVVVKSEVETAEVPSAEPAVDAVPMEGVVSAASGADASVPAPTAPSPTAQPGPAAPQEPAAPQFKYDRLFQAAIARLQFPPVYYLNFGESTAIATGWSIEQDRDLMIGTVKHGYQNYEKMRVDPQLVFATQNWITADQAKAMAKEAGGDTDLQLQLPPVFPSVSDIGSRIRRLLSFMQRDIRSGTRRLQDGPALTLNSEDHRWTRRERTDFARVISYWGLPEDVRMKMTRDEATRNKYRIVSTRVRNGLVTVRVRDWTDFKRLASLENKADYAMDVFADHLVPALERLADELRPPSAQRHAARDTDSVCSEDRGSTVSGPVVEATPKQQQQQQQPGTKATIIKINLQTSASSTPSATAASKNAAAEPVPLDVFGVPLDFMVDGIMAERAKRLLRRIALFKTLRGTILHDAYLDTKLSAMRRSPGLPDWWQVNVHDRALLLGVAKHGFFADRQNLILFDPELPFHGIAEQKILEMGLDAAVCNPYLQAPQTTAPTTEDVKAAVGDDEEAVVSQQQQQPPVAASEADVDNAMQLDDEEEEESETKGEQQARGNTTPAPKTPAGCSTAPTVNIEDLFGWPRDIIRQRRVEIIIDAVLRPSERILAQVRALKKKSGVSALRRDQSDDDEAFDPDFLRHLSDSEEDDFEIVAGGSLRRQIKRLRGTIRLLQRYAKSPALRSLVENFSADDSDDTLEHALTILDTAGASAFTEDENQDFYVDMENIRSASTLPDGLDAPSKHKMKQLVARRRIMAEMRQSIAATTPDQSPGPLSTSDATTLPHDLMHE